jgi:predicted O-linked N-acetylglucosamine transferase (SPINDLY family)
MFRAFLARLSKGRRNQSAGLDATAEEFARQYQAHAARQDYAAAAAALESALRLRPDWTDARYNLGAMLLRLERFEEAEAAYRQVIAADADRPLAYRMLGNVLHRQGRIAELLQVLSAARRRLPEDFDLESFELLALLFSESASAAELFERHHAYGARLERAIEPLAPAAPPDPRRRLRIGYVSGDLCTHPVAQFLRPVLAQRDRSAFEAYCYSVGTRVDGTSRELAGHADAWRAAATFDDAQLAAAIRADGIDVLVDLSGHSGISRLPMFARQPARVQASWLGYLHSTGLSRIQYRITDALADPTPDAEGLHTEALLQLPHSQWCYRPLAAVDASPRRAGHFTFGSFNQVAKLSPATRRLWIQILRDAPGARLALTGIPEGPARTTLLAEFAAGGIDANRLDFAPHISIAEYFARIGAVDVALDPTPYSGGTTTLDALWMGIPVVTLAGERSVSRSAASILRTLGLREWIAHTPQEYVATALGAARAPEALATLRASLRPRLRASPLMDELRFARDFEALLRRIAYT